LNVRYVFITECTDASKERVRTLAFWEDDHFIDNYEYDLAGEPCEVLFHEAEKHASPVLFALQYERKLSELFVEEAGFESYIGITIGDAEGDIIGHMVVMDDEEIPRSSPYVSILQIFAARAGAELEREQAYRQLEMRVEQRTAEIQRRRRVAESLRDILARLNSTDTLDDVLSFIVSQVIDLLFCDASAVCQIETETRVYRVQASRGLGERTILKEKSHSQRVVHQCIYNRTPVTVEDFSMYDDEGHEFSAMLSAPLIIQGEVYGCLILYYSKTHHFTDDERELAMMFADQVSLAIENAHLREQTQAMGALEERNRLARELHDAVSQTLWSASLLSDVIPDLWENNQDAGRRRLDQLRQLNRVALAEMRGLLLELRPSALTEVALPDLLEQLARTTHSRTGITIDVNAVGICTLSPDTQIAIYRIAQEALNNAVKHANAANVIINLNLSDDENYITVQDNGDGIPADRARHDSLGMKIMRERAESIGANLYVQSNAGEGTTVRLTWSK
ncbi:MAG: GAF domain-containing sensor histidine kinase, partial [Chloroflexota bacterium]